MRAVHRYPDGAEVHDASDQVNHFDAVAIATHPDQALRLLAKPSQPSEDVLGAFRYTKNPALLHTDARLLPGRPGGSGPRGTTSSPGPPPMSRRRPHGAPGSATT